MTVMAILEAHPSRIQPGVLARCRVDLFTRGELYAPVCQVPVAVRSHRRVDLRYIAESADAREHNHEARLVQWMCDTMPLRFQSLLPGTRWVLMAYRTCQSLVHWCR
jgi:hypothetical protein